MCVAVTALLPLLSFQKSYVKGFNHNSIPINCQPGKSAYHTMPVASASISLLSALDDNDSEPTDDSSAESLSFELDPDSALAQEMLTSKLQLTDQQQRQLIDYCDLIVEWNDKINLISRKDCNRNVVFGRHILPCLAPILLPSSENEQQNQIIEAGSKVIDVGTGGGLPGIPLAICHPEADFLLVDSVGKELKAVDDIIKRLQLQNAKTQHNRAEQVVTDDGKTSECFDWCVGRSVASLPKYCSWTHHLLKPTGKLMYIIGGDVPEASIAECDESVHELIMTPANGLSESRLVPVSDKRILVFPKDAVVTMAKVSGNYRTIKQMKKLSDAQKNGKKKKQGGAAAAGAKLKPKVKGAWDKKRDQPKQRGYDDFHRYSSN